MKSNVQIWQKLHKDDAYFTLHPCYVNRQLKDDGMQWVHWCLNWEHNRNVLEIGCGYGRLLYHLTDLFSEVIGVDLADEPLEQARQLLEQYGKNATLIKTDGVSLQPVKDGSIDNIISVNVFQHMTRDIAKNMMYEIVRVLRFGGTAILQFVGGPNYDRDVDLSKVKEQSLEYSFEQLQSMTHIPGLKLVHCIRQELPEPHYPKCYYWLVLKKI